MGWGEPGVGPNGVVHYAYAGKGRTATTGTSSTYVPPTTAQTWSYAHRSSTPTPTQYQDPVDAFTVRQLQPSLPPGGKVTVSWYDRRQATSACNIVTDPGCSYERYGVSRLTTASHGVELRHQLGRHPAADTERSAAFALLRRRLRLQHCAGRELPIVTWTDGRVCSRRRSGAERGI